MSATQLTLESKIKALSALAAVVDHLKEPVALRVAAILEKYGPQNKTELRHKVGEKEPDIYLDTLIKGGIAYYESRSSEYGLTVVGSNVVKALSKIRQELTSNPNSFLFYDVDKTVLSDELKNLDI